MTTVWPGYCRLGHCASCCCPRVTWLQVEPLCLLLLSLRDRCAGPPGAGLPLPDLQPVFEARMRARQERQQSGSRAGMGPGSGGGVRAEASTVAEEEEDAGLFVRFALKRKAGPSGSPRGSSMAAKHQKGGSSGVDEGEEGGCWGDAPGPGWCLLCMHACGGGGGRAGGRAGGWCSSI